MPCEQKAFKAKIVFCLPLAWEFATGICSFVLENKSIRQRIFAHLNWDGSFNDFILRTDWLMPVLLFTLSSWGIAAIYSSGGLDDLSVFDNDFARKQMMFVALGWAVYWTVSLIDYKHLGRFATWLYALGIGFLIPVAICGLLKKDLPGLIEMKGGAHRWISFGSYSLQPSEIAKFTTLLMLSLMAGRGVTVGRLFRWERALAKIGWAFTPARWAGNLPNFYPLILRVGWLAFLPFALIFVQPDLASSLIYVPMAFALLFVANIPLRFFALLGALVLPFVALLAADMSRYAAALEAYQASNTSSVRAADPATGIRHTFKDGILPIRNYQRERIMALINPTLIDPQGNGKSYQVTQGMMAIAQGGLSGQGFQNGMLVRLGYLPEDAAHNDFLFASLTEESGFIGGCSVIGMFALLIALAMRAAATARDRFGSCLAVGVAVIVAVHVVINIGMNIGLLPVAGVPLPFLSYGGSFVLSCFLLFGLVQSVHRSSRPQVEQNTEPADLLVPAQLSGRSPV